MAATVPQCWTVALPYPVRVCRGDSSAMPLARRRDTGRRRGSRALVLVMAPSSARCGECVVLPAPDGPVAGTPCAARRVEGDMSENAKQMIRDCGFAEERLEDLLGLDGLVPPMR